jgi:hypothetical protein
LIEIYVIIYNNNDVFLPANLEEYFIMNKKSASGLIKIIVSSLILTGTLAFVTCDDDKKDDNSLLMLLAKPKLILYNAGTHNGNLGGRSGADALCDASGNKPDGVTNVHAFLSVDATDQIKDLPATYGYSTQSSIYGPDGKSKIADNWAQFIGFGPGEVLNMDLKDAGVLPDSTQFLTGSNANGTEDPGWTCTGWTSSASATVDVGYSYLTNFLWIAAASGNCADTTNYLVCIGEK